MSGAPSTPLQAMALQHAQRRWWLAERDTPFVFEGQPYLLRAERMGTVSARLVTVRPPGMDAPAAAGLVLVWADHRMAGDSRRPDLVHQALANGQSLPVPTGAPSGVWRVMPLAAAA